MTESLVLNELTTHGPGSSPRIDAGTKSSIAGLQIGLTARLTLPSGKVAVLKVFGVELWACEHPLR